MATAALSPAATPYHFPPGPTGREFARLALAPGGNALSRLETLHRRYGAAFTIRLRKRAVVFLIGPEANQYILGTHAASFTQGAAIRLSPVLGTGLLTSDGDFHARKRRLVQPAFHRGRIAAYQQAMVDETARAVAGWHAGQTLDFAAAMHDLTLTIVGRTLFDVDLADATGEISGAVTNIARFLRFQPFSWRNIHRDWPGLPYHRFLRDKATMDRLVYHLIAERRADDRDRGDILSMLLAARDADGGALSDAQVRDEVMTFLAAGHETTANALGWTFYLLAQYPDARDRLAAEIRDVLGDRPPQPDDGAKMPYLDAVIKESMRLYPPAWAGTRIAREDVSPRGYHLPAGTVVGFSQYLTHRLPECFPEPDAFRPERFEAALPPYAYIPFGAGPRACIGSGFALTELKTMVPIILQRFHLALAPGARITLEPMITLRAKHGIPMVLREE